MEVVDGKRVQRSAMDVMTDENLLLRADTGTSFSHSPSYSLKTSTQSAWQSPSPKDYMIPLVVGQGLSTNDEDALVSLHNPSD
jgi:hypothetical protein